MGKKLNRIWKGILIECIGIMVLAVMLLTGAENGNEKISIEVTGQAEKEYIKWVDFTVTYEALCKAYDWDVKTYGTEYRVGWVELLAYTAAKTGGNFDKKALGIMDKAAK